MPSNHLVLCRPPSPPALISIFPRIRVYSNELALHIRWSNYWNFTSSISPFNEYSRLISFRIDWFDLLVVQGILKSLLQHHSSKTSVLWCSVFFMVQLSHPYQTTGKNIALTFVSKVMFLLFNMLSRFIIAFLPRSKHLLISSLKSPSAVLLEPKKIKSATVSISPPYICFPSDASGKEPSLPMEVDKRCGFDSLPSWEDSQEEEMETHLSILAWKIPLTEEPGRLQSIGLCRVGHN